MRPRRRRHGVRSHEDAIDATAPRSRRLSDGRGGRVDAVAVTWAHEDAIDAKFMQDAEIRTGAVSMVSGARSTTGCSRNDDRAQSPFRMRPARAAKQKRTPASRLA